jgi:hypothetical protein
MPQSEPRYSIQSSHIDIHILVSARIVGFELMVRRSRRNLHDHLLAAEKRVANELARAQRNWLLLVRHVDEYVNRSIRESACDAVIETEYRRRVVVDEGRWRLGI